MVNPWRTWRTWRVAMAVASAVRVRKLSRVQREANSVSVALAFNNCRSRKFSPGESCGIES